MSRPALVRIAAVAVALSTAVLIVAIAVLPFFSPTWLALVQDRADAAAWTGYTPDQVRTVTDALVHDLVLGPPEFAVAIDGRPVLAERERSHLRDVRNVFGGLALLALLSAAILLVGWRAAGASALRRWVRGGALALAGGTVVLGVVAAVAFEAAFAVFHVLLFPDGTWTFDPRTDRLVQLFPSQLWFETSLAAGATIIGASLVVAWLAGRGAPVAAGRPAEFPGGRRTEPTPAGGDPR